MKFAEIEYERPDIDWFKSRVFNLLEKFDLTDSFEMQTKIIDEINTLRNNILTKLTIVQIRNLTDMTKTKYRNEQKHSDEKWPVYEMVVSRYYDSLTRSKNKNEIENKYGKQLIDIAKVNVNTVNNEVISDLEKENKLISKYLNIIAKSKVEFMGQERNLSQLDTFLTSSDRNIRKSASEKKYQLMNQNENEIDTIFGDLIKIRTDIAHKLGFNSFVELGYARLSRIDYEQEDVKKFRDMISSFIVPLATELRENQRKRLKLDILRHYDEDYRFISGNATPNGDADWITNRFKNTFNNLSTETGEAFNFMYEKDLLNLKTKTGKARGAFTTFLCDYKSPYIFANFNGTRNDVKVFSHEFGHAFQMYIYNRENEIPEYILPTKEACEITSIAMEYMIWPWLENFFGDSAENYKYTHLEDAILTIPYRACIDEFQHYIYNNPATVSSEWKKKWTELERKYLPYKCYDDNQYLKRGNYWQIQSHLFKFPFYYIDYALAQFCALQIWALSQIDIKEAWGNYMEICKKGGSLSFLELIESTGILSPFEEDAFKKMISVISDWFKYSSLNNDYS